MTERPPFLAERPAERDESVSADPLSDVLRAVRLDGAFFYAVEASEPWSVKAVAAKELTPRVLPGAEHLISYHILTAGHCYGGLVGGEPVGLEQGDVIVFPHGDAHVMSSDPKLASVPAVPGRYPETLTIGEGGHVAATFVCGFLGCDRRPVNPLLSPRAHPLPVPGLRRGARHVVLGLPRVRQPSVHSAPVHAAAPAACAGPRQRMAPVVRAAGGRGIAGQAGGRRLRPDAPRRAHVRRGAPALHRDAPARTARLARGPPRRVGRPRTWPAPRRPRPSVDDRRAGGGGGPVGLGGWRTLSPHSWPAPPA